MRIFLFFLLLISLSVLVDCKHPKVHVRKIEVEENRVHHINVDSTYDQIDLKLSDLADSFRVVRLESSGKAMINANSFSISEKYIIAYSEDGIYKFSSEGRFLKKIISWGRGPDEISGFLFSEYYDEKKDLLYLDDINLKQKILVYDVNLDRFIDPVKKAISGPIGFSIYNDSLIIGTSSSYDSGERKAIFLQTLSGKLVFKIPSTKKTVFEDKSEHFQVSRIINANNNYLIAFSSDDTLFTFINNRMEPYLVFKFKKPRDNSPSGRSKKGDRDLRFPRVEPPNFLIICVSTIEEITWFGTVGKHKSSYQYYFFDRSTGKTSIIRTYEDNFSGEIQSSTGVISPTEYGTIKFPDFLKNGKLIVVYQPNTIKNIAEKGQINSILTPILKEKIVHINRSLHETDNPVLLIGRVKEKI